MVRDGVIERYAIGGAVAACNYIEPALTEDLGIFVSFQAAPRSALISLEPILPYLRKLGYKDFSKEGVVIEGWPVQFLPISDALDVEAVADAQIVKINGGEVRARVMTPQHLVALALRVGRAKDILRVTQSLHEKAVNLRQLKDVLGRHKLLKAWRAYCVKSGTRDPLAVK
jgi:hypothetical protein